MTRARLTCGNMEATAIKVFIRIPKAFENDSSQKATEAPCFALPCPALAELSSRANREVRTEFPNRSQQLVVDE